MNLKIHSPRKAGPVFTGLLILAAAPLPAATVYSGIVDLDIPNNFNGIYLDFEAANSTTPGNDADLIATDSYTLGYSAAQPYDINLFFGGIGISYSDTFRPLVDDPVSNLSQILNVAENTEIASEAVAHSLGIASGVYGGSGTSNGAVGQSHFDVPDLNSDPNYSAFTPGQEGYLAFVINPGTVDENYGWMRLTLTNDGTVGTIHDWAYSDDVNFEVGAIPEPSTFLLSLLGTAALFRRRRD